MTLVQPVMVFGSNTIGRHGRAAALFAARYKGAVEGVGEGLRGDSYALPTKSAALKTLSLAQIQASVERFIAFARGTPDRRYHVTRVGCGLAGYTDADIAPLFAGAPVNCVLPYLWHRMANPALPCRVIVAGSRSFDDFDLMTRKLDALLASLPRPVEIVSGTARGADRMGEAYAKAHQWPCSRHPAQWDLYGKKVAGHIRNQHMAWYASHLVAFHDGQSTGTRNMIATARADGLATRVVLFASPSPD